MLKELKNTIISLNNGVKDVANCEKAKKLRKKLLCIGLPLAIIGFLGAFTCFVLFATAGFSAFDSNGFSNRIIIPAILEIPFFIMGAIGVSISSLGFKIVITGYASNLIDEKLGNNCPNCRQEIISSEIYCSSCGEKVRKECSNCKHINNIKSEFCEKCGKKL